MIDDVGAGALMGLARFGLKDEPTLPASIRAGADIVTSSADKLIGGPQGGIIIGRAHLIEAIRKNPLARAVRVDKLSLAALEATLGLFLDETCASSDLPILKMLLRDLRDVAAQAERVADALRDRCQGITVTTVEGSSQMGSGSLPEQNIPTRLVAIAAESIRPEALALLLRRHRPPVFTRIQRGQVLIDPRTLLEGEEQAVVEALVWALDQ